jgi:hypothetical protein
MNARNYWRYTDAAGVDRTGAMEGFSDFGGTDVTYRFRQDNGALDLVSGSRLKAARRLGNFGSAEEANLSSQEGGR